MIMRYKYKVRELGPKTIGIQKETYVDVGESKDMEAMSLKKLKGNFISATISGKERN
jgi:hypothetical protein